MTLEQLDEFRKDWIEFNRIRQREGIVRLSFDDYAKQSFGTSDAYQEFQQVCRAQRNRPYQPTDSLIS